MVTGLVVSTSQIGGDLVYNHALGIETESDEVRKDMVKRLERDFGAEQRA